MTTLPAPNTSVEGASKISSEIRPLTGIRGIAAFYVVLFHFFSSWLILLPSIKPLAGFSNKGYLGVDLFFILSGFILYFTYDKFNHPLTFKEYQRFLWNRFARIYPNHLATIVILSILVGASHMKGIRVTGGYPTIELLYQLSMTHAWSAAVGWIESGNWNYPSWSISAEWFAYVFIFPIGWWLLSRRISAAFAMPICLIILSFLVFYLNPMLVASEKDQLLQLFQVSLEFLCGGFLFKAFQYGNRFVKICTKHVFAILAAIIVILLVPSDLFPFGPALTVMCFPFLLLGLTAEDSVLSKFLASNLLVWSGKISYAVYMSHAIVQKSLKVILPWNDYQLAPASVRIVIVLANLAAIIICASLLYYLVEIPCRNTLRRYCRVAR